MKTVLLLSFALSLLLLTTASAQTPPNNTQPNPPVPTVKPAVSGNPLFHINFDPSTMDIVSSERIEFLLINRGASTTNFVYQIFDRNASGNYRSFSLNDQPGVWNSIIGTTATLSCQLLRDNSTGNMSLLRFMNDTITFFPIPQQPLNYSSQPKEFYQRYVRVGEGCNRFGFNQTIYRLDPINQSFVAYVFPTGTTIQEASPDLNYVIGSSQLFKFNNQTGSYTSVKTLVRRQVYEMFSNKNAFVIVGMTFSSIVVMGAPGPNQPHQMNNQTGPVNSTNSFLLPITNFTITTLFDNGASIQQIESFSGAYQGSFPLGCIRSPNLTKFGAEYTKINATSTTIFARSFNFVAMTSTRVTFQNLQHYKDISVNLPVQQIVLSDNYLYVRQTSNQTMPVEGCYQFLSSSLVEIRENLLNTSTIDTWGKSWIDNTRTNEMVVISAFATSSGLDLLDFNFGSLGSNTNPAANPPAPYIMLTPPPSPTTATVAYAALSWSYAVSAAGNTTFSFFDANPNATSHLEQSNLTLIGAYSIVAENQRCKFIWDGASSFLALFKNGSTGYRIFGDASSALTGYTMGEISVSSGCELIQVAGLVYILTPQNGTVANYTMINQIGSGTPFKPVLNRDLTVGFFNGSLWGISNQTKNYTKLLDDNLLSPVQVWAVPGRVIVLSVNSSANTFSVRLNAYGSSGPSGQLRRFFNFSGDFQGSPKVLVSPNLTQVLLMGAFVHPNQTVADAKGFNLNFPQMTFVENKLPRDQLSISGSITLNVTLFDDYVYVRQANGSMITEQAFSFTFGTTLGVYNAAVSADVAAAYVRTVLGIDPSNQNLLIFTETVRSGDVVVNLKAISPKAAPQTPTSGGSVVEDGKEIRCSPGCKSCSSSQICTACGYGFLLNPTLASCSFCGPQCLACSSATVCTTCFNGTFLNSSNQCQPCDRSCAACSGSALTCTLCPPRTVLNGSSSCVNVTIKNCVASAGASCTTCANGFAVTGLGACRQCSSKCGACDPLNITLCTDCGPNMQLVAGSCIRCPEKCSACNSGNCIKCIPGFTAINGACQPSCSPSCKTCKMNQPNACTSCYGSSTVVNDACIQDATCSTYLNCTSCNLGFVLVLGACFKCNTADVNCIQCSSDNTQQCVQCAPKYYINPISYSCMGCPQVCTSCLSSTSCTSCSNGYTLLTGSTASTCYACTSNCSTCSDSTDNCLSCVSGYDLNGWKCISASNVAYTLVLGTDLPTAMNSLDTIIQSLATILKITDYNDITINNLVSGSISIYGTVSSPNPVEASAALATSINGGTNFAGFNVISASFAASNQPADSNTQLLAIILGVLLPLLAIIIGVVVYFKCIRKPPITQSENSAMYPAIPSNYKNQFQLVSYSYDASTIGVKIVPGQSLNLKEVEA